jgi:hypothetical protein
MKAWNSSACCCLYPVTVECLHLASSSLEMLTVSWNVFIISQIYNVFSSGEPSDSIRHVRMKGNCNLRTYNLAIKRSRSLESFYCLCL